MGQVVEASAEEPSLLDAVRRLARLLDNPGEAPVLKPMLTKEIVYRLLQGDQSSRLRQIAVLDGNNHRMAVAVERPHFSHEYRRFFGDPPSPWWESGRPRHSDRRSEGGARLNGTVGMPYVRAGRLESAEQWNRTRSGSDCIVAPTAYRRSGGLSEIPMSRFLLSPYVLVLLAGVLVALSASRAAGQTYPGEHWERTAPEEQCVDGETLERAVAAIAAFSGEQGASQAVVVRNGHLIWSGDQIDERHRIWSCTKGFTGGLVFGLMVEDGLVDPEDFAHRYLPYLERGYDQVRLSHFATMTSGYDADGSDQSSTWWRAADPLFDPGDEYLYWDAAYNELVESR